VSQAYFTGLNYSMANEDTRFEYELTEKLKPKKIISVCGSGGRALPLIIPETQEMICVDLSEEQLLLLELRKVTIESLNFQDFLKFWGYPPYFIDRFTETRQEIFYNLMISKSCRGYFQKVFSHIRWSSLLYEGKWEKTFITLSKAAILFLGIHREKIFQFDNLEAQIHYYENEFPKKRWMALLSLLGNKAIFNRLLYKGSFVKKNIKGSYRQFYIETFDKLFRQDLARNSFFLQLCLLGEVRYEEGNTIEAQEEGFLRMKNSLSQGAKITGIKEDLISAIKKQAEVDFISMSDVPSYFSGSVEKNFLSDIHKSLSDDGIVVIRSYLRVPGADRSGYEDITSEFQHLVDQEKVGVYKIEVLRRV